MLNGSDRFAPLDILVSILDLRNEFVFPSIFQYITLSCLHQPPHTTLVVFYVSIPPFPCLPPLVSCLNHQVCFSSFFSFLVPCGFAPCCGNDKLSVPLGEKGVKKKSLRLVSGPSWTFTSPSTPDGPGRLHWAHSNHQLICTDCLNFFALCSWTQ